MHKNNDLFDVCTRKNPPENIKKIAHLLHRNDVFLKNVCTNPKNHLLRCFIIYFTIIIWLATQKQWLSRCSYTKTSSWNVKKIVDVLHGVDVLSWKWVHKSKKSPAALLHLMYISPTPFDSRLKKAIFFSMFAHETILLKMSWRK